MSAPLLVAALAVLSGTIGAAEYNPVKPRATAAASPVHRVIVKMRASAAGAATQKSSAVANADRVAALAKRTGLTMKSERALTPRLHAMQVVPANGEPESQTLSRLRADPEVEYAVLDRRVHAHAVPNDPLGPTGGGQWYLQAAQPSAIDATDAWDITQGSDAVVIALMDTGVRFEHPDLGRVGSGGRLLPGYDFISADSDKSFFTANDGDGRDPDASDPGDWNTVQDNCGDPSDSSWHGTRTSGIIGALTNNSTGIAGITWKGPILPVRVLGRCGGNNSDVLEGMLWAAGQDVGGVPHNDHPAKIINISLGATGACDSATQEVVQQVTALGVLVVSSAGNEGGPVDSPANCTGVVGVAGLRHAGTKVGYSSLGPEVALAAPAGNCVNTDPGSPCLFSIDTTVNEGTTTPTTSGYSDQFNSNLGTSFSAPIVSGIAGLMLAVNGNLKPADLVARLKEGAKPFPTSSENANVPNCHVPASSSDVQGAECVCTTSVCGAGMANALGAVNAALRPIAVLSVQGTAGAGADVTLQAGGSTAADGHTIASYAWVENGNQIGSAPSLSYTVPATGTAAVCLTVSDDAGKQDRARVDIVQGVATVTGVASSGASCQAGEVSVAATDASAAESGDTGTFTFSRTGDVSAALTVAIALSGTATSGKDYQALGSTASFAAGAATTTLTLSPINTSTGGGSRTAIVTLQPGSNYSLGAQTSATVTIAEDTLVTKHKSGGGSLDALLLAALALAWLYRSSRYLRRARGR
ncbi:MAG TPA: S8 family serine peptidase [Steroidobacteraceae bacterium]|nr:S8 family serine peptidase [Steroidobacteraceae bacterium]